ncbi:MAG TPA: hypothetical protein PKL83_00700 [bacterium]|nr:hypothetical protein [bacterium]
MSRGKILYLDDAAGLVEHTGATAAFNRKQQQAIEAAKPQQTLAEERPDIQATDHLPETGKLMGRLEKWVDQIQILATLHVWDTWQPPRALADRPMGFLPPRSRDRELEYVAVDAMTDLDHIEAILQKGDTDHLSMNQWYALEHYAERLKVTLRFFARVLDRACIEANQEADRYTRRAVQKM